MGCSGIPFCISNHCLARLAARLLRERNMTDFSYTDKAQELQARFDTSNLASAMLSVIVHDELTVNDKNFICSRDMFWLSSVDDHGMPTVSYKGGAPGFVQALDHTTLLFPSYDGNGMFYSMGNIATSAKIGLLFMDFENPYRLRVQGEASLTDDKNLVARFPGAQLAVRVAVKTIFQNCPRYVHRMQRVSQSRYVPAADGSAPLAGWKRIDAIQPVLAAKDQGKAQGAGGLISSGEWDQMVSSGDHDA